MRTLLLVALASILGVAVTSPAGAQTPVPTVEPGTIRGVVFHDVNANGVPDTGEKGLQSRTITVRQGNLTAGRVSSDSNGEYVLSVGPTGGSYTVTASIDAHQGICSSGVATFNPFPYTFCVSATIPWHNTTPTEVSVTVSATTGAVADFGARPADVVVLEGLALLEDSYAPAGTLIEANR